MKLIDKNPKKRPDVLDNFMTVPAKMTTKKKKALQRLQELHKRKFAEAA